MLILFAYTMLCRATAISWISQGFWAMLLRKTVECPCAATMKCLKTQLYDCMSSAQSITLQRNQRLLQILVPWSQRYEISWNFSMLVRYIGYSLAQPFIACHSNRTLGQIFLLPLTSACPPTPCWCICLPHSLRSGPLCGSIYSRKPRLVETKSNTMQQNWVPKSKSRVRQSCENKVKISTSQLQKAPNSQ